MVQLAAEMRGSHATDEPADLSLVACRFLRTWNDGLDARTRQSLMPFAERLSRTTPAHAAESARATRVSQWLTEEGVPRWLACAGEPGIARRLRDSQADGSEAALVQAIREVRRFGADAVVDRCRGPVDIQARLLSSGCAPAWVACRDWGWTQGCRYQMAGSPALRTTWYSWLLCWRSLQLAMARGSAAIPATEAALRRSAFVLLVDLLEQ